MLPPSLPVPSFFSPTESAHLISVLFTFGDSSAMNWKDNPLTIDAYVLQSSLLHIKLGPYDWLGREGQSQFVDTGYTILC